jgi:deoxycytidylate deaminase
MRNSDWLRYATKLATNSEDPDARDRVACLITHGDTLISAGKNHTLDGSYMRDHCAKAVPQVVHAETAAIQDALTSLQGLRYSWRLEAYCTKEPCLHCLVQLANAGVNEVHYIDPIPAAKSGKAILQHLPSIKVYKEHPDQLPNLLRVLGVHTRSGSQPASCVAS